MSTLPVQRKSRFGCFTQVFFALLLGVVVIGGVTALLAPWGFFMGGHFHPLAMWQGWGRLHSNHVGDYALYMVIHPDFGRSKGTTHVAGTGVLCTPRGERYNLSVGGDFGKGYGTDLQGRTASFYMDNNSVKSQFVGGARYPYLELRGKWNNPDLVLDDHGSLTRAFEPDGSLYTGHSTSRSYMLEVVPVTLHEGSMNDFEAACAALKKR